MTTQPHTDDNNVPQAGDHVFLSNIDVADDDYQSVKRTENAIALGKAHNGSYDRVDYISLQILRRNSGHYEIPAEYKPQNQPLQITGRSDPIIMETSTLNITGTKLFIAGQSDMSNDTTRSENNRNWQRIISKTYSTSKMWFNRQENIDAKWIAIPITLTIGTIVAWYLYKQRKDQLQHASQVRHRTELGKRIGCNYYIRVELTKLNLCAKSSRESSRSNDSGKSVNSVIVQEEIGDGSVKVGKITFDTRQVLGKGCEGTFVYKYVIHHRYIISTERLFSNAYSLGVRSIVIERRGKCYDGSRSYIPIHVYRASQMSNANDDTVNDDTKTNLAIPKEKCRSHTCRYTRREAIPHSGFVQMSSEYFFQSSVARVDSIVGPSIR